MTALAHDLTRAKVIVLSNTRAGRRDTKAYHALLHEKLAPAVKDLSIWPLKHGRGIEDLARRAALQERADLVVALGGDGTQSAVASGLSGTDAVMGVLPGGTFNYFARGLGVGTTHEAAVETLLTGVPRLIDLAEINGRVFLNNVSFGLYPAILERREAVYRRWGRSRLGAYISVLLGLRDLGDPMHLRLRVAGLQKDVQTPLAFVSCSAFQLESLGLEGAEAIRSGHLAVFLARSHSRRGLAAAAFRLAMGTSRRGQDFDLIEADEIIIEKRRHAQVIAFDGEKLRMPGPYHLALRRGALRVIAPLHPVVTPDQVQAS